MNCYSLGAILSCVALLQGCKSASGGAKAGLASTPVSANGALGEAVTTQQLRDHENLIEKKLPHNFYEVVLNNYSGSVEAPGGSGADCAALKKAKAANEDPTTGIQQKYADMLGFKYCKANPVVSLLSCKRAFSCAHPIVEKGKVRYITVLQDLDYKKGDGSDAGGFDCGTVFDRIQTIDGRSHELTEGESVYTFTGKQDNGAVSNTGCRFVTYLN